ncbi:MAG: DUF2244 domain-containing protein [Burkholderiales bacterium]
MDEPRIEVDALDSGAGFSLTTRRNCSLPPHALAWLLAFTACFSFAIGFGFAAVGAWPVLPFVGLEVLALASAFCVHALHAADYERIVVRHGAMRVEVREAGRVRVHDFHPGWVRVCAQRAEGSMRVGVRSHGRELEIGRHLDAPARGLLAAELASRLKRYRDGGSS